ncbi:hypothetical protein F503_02412 [Ophiostoma piceae UAMH 11346]|uniref:Uncharacterized protein n=1 Tax=Ophiostoma piceae (strain UAMH 11346) TaxID=1262450 RepID=S3BYH1_OPHP1|nr:hypothetical protein F503_02412 [Ophiostoma piceae UAMH 11346]
MAMSADLNTSATNSIEDKLGIGRRELIETLLNDVVTVEVLDKVNDPVAKSFDDDLDLLLSRDKLDHLLKGPRAVLIESDADHVLSSILDEDDHMDLVRDAVLELLLEVAAAVLVLAKLVNGTADSLQRHVVKAVHGYIEGK